MFRIALVSTTCGLFLACSSPKSSGTDAAAITDAPVTAQDLPSTADVSSAHEAQPVEAQPVEAQPVEAQPVEAQPVDAQPVDAQPVDAQPVDAQPVDAQPVDAPRGEAQPLPEVTCEDFLRHQRECGRLTDAGTTGDEYCARMAEARQNWRPEYFATFFACMVAHECSMDDDECAIEALRASADGLIDLPSLDACLQAPSQPCEPVYFGIFADCMDRYDECKTDAGYGTFADDRCVTLAALNDERRAQVPACLALDCSSISNCLGDLGTFTF